MTAKVRDFETTLSGKVEPVKLPPKIAREYRLAGFQVTRNRVLMVPNVARRVRRTKALPTASAGGYASDIYVPSEGTMIQKVYLPATVGNWDEFFKRLRRGDFEKLKRPQDVFAFTFYGGMSQKTFKNSEELADWLQHYKTIEDYPGLTWEHFIIYKVYPPGTWEELGGGLTYRVAHSRSRRRDARGNPIPRGIGSRARKTMAEIKATEQARKHAANMTPEKKVKNAAYMKNYRGKLAAEQDRKVRAYKKRK